MTVGSPGGEDMRPTDRQQHTGFRLAAPMVGWTGGRGSDAPKLASGEAGRSVRTNAGTPLASLLVPATAERVTSDPRALQTLVGHCRSRSPTTGTAISSGGDAEAGAALEAAQGHGAAMESNHPSGGLLRPAGFEDRMGIRLVQGECVALNGLENR
jgi:hypothetical protein